MSAAMEIPLVPVIAVKSTSGISKSGLDFERFAEHVYGTPKILGWWPDLMEDAAAALAAAGDDVPSLTVASQLFETAAEGKSAVDCQMILENVVPALQLSAEGKVEEELHALGAKKLDFKAFAQLLCKICPKEN